MKTCGSPPTSIAIDDPLTYSPAPAGVSFVASRIITYQPADDDWLALGDGCWVTDFPYCENSSLDDVLAQVAANINIVPAYPPGPPDGSEYRNIDGYRCKFSC
jgi:hypothetical protein